jgi:hypothetical protein
LLTGAFVVLAVGVMGVLYVMYGDDHSDIGAYHNYALAFFFPDGAARHLPIEYPPLALVPFSVTLIPLGIDYGALFTLVMAVVFLASCVVVARAASLPVAKAYVIYMLLAGPLTLLGRYDLVTALVVLAAIVAAGHRRWPIAYALLALGVLLKLYPVILLPVFAIEQWRTARRRIWIPPAIFGLIVVACFGAAALIDPAGWISPFRYALQRPVESESVPATVLWLLSGLESPGNLVHSFNSANVVSPSATFVAALSPIALAAGCVAAYVRHLSGKLTLGQACLACLAVVLATSKVLSPQYLIWILPLVAFVVGLDPVWIGVCVLTFLVYPVLFELTGLASGGQATAFAPVFLATVATRNGLLLIAAWRALQGPARAPALAGG